MATTNGADNVVREFNALGQNRVRLLMDPKRGPLLDIREYLTEADFTGFTRKGVRLDVAQLEQLRDIVAEALALANGKPDETKRPTPRKAAPAVVAVNVARDNATSQAAARALRPMVRPQTLNAARRAKAENAVPTSILPPALQELRARMRNGETISPEELSRAMNNWKPKEAPVKPETVQCATCDTMIPNHQDLRYCPACCEADRLEKVRDAFNEQTPDGRRLGDSIMDGILNDTMAKLG